MAVLDLKQKLSILADAAKYDASCASSEASLEVSVALLRLRACHAVTTPLLALAHNSARKLAS